MKKKHMKVTDTKISLEVTDEGRRIFHVDFSEEITDKEVIEIIQECMVGTREYDK
jgi:hypothetical protein